MFLNFPFTVVTYFAVYAINTQYIVHYFKQLYLGAIKNMKKKIIYFTFLFIFLVLIQASHLYHIPSAQRTTFNISYRVNLLAMNSVFVCLGEYFFFIYEGCFHLM